MATQKKDTKKINVFEQIEKLLNAAEIESIQFKKISLNDGETLKYSIDINGKDVSGAHKHLEDAAVSLTQKLNQEADNALKIVNAIEL